MKVSAHCHSLKGMNNCIDAGFSSIEHGTFIDRKTASKMVKNNVSLVPTLLVHQFLYKNGFPSWDSYASEKTAKLKEIVKVHKENISVAYDEGVNILMGTDSGVIPHGHNLEELTHLIEIGMSEDEAIAAGTVKAAEFLNKDNLGLVKENYIADLILVNSNPLDDISILSDNDNILNVIQDGVLVKMKLLIDESECIGCGQCKSVCIRDNIEIDEVAYETGSNCFECGHCMAICPTCAMTLKIFKGREGRIEDYNSKEIPVNYDELLAFLKQRRSIRWFKKKKIDKDTFNKLIEGAYYSPSAQNEQDVEFVVLDKKLNDFMKHVYDIIKVEEDEFFRIKQFGDYLKTIQQKISSFPMAGPSVDFNLFNR